MSFRTLEDLVIQQTNEVMGADCIYTQNSEEVEIKGVFDNSYVDIEGMVSLKPTLRIRLLDLSEKPTKADSVSISDISYRVLESREDGFGGSTLILQKA